MAKKAFDLSRNSIYVADPNDLRIVGGARFLVGDERGPLDTEDDPSHPLWDERRLKEALPKPFIANITHHGVIVPVSIVKDDDVPTVGLGKSRVRGARVANVIRAARGEPLIKIECRMSRLTGIGLTALMTTENEARRDDGPMAKMERAFLLLGKGMSEEDVAMHFAISRATLDGWIAFTDNATAETKQAVIDGRVSATAAAELARVKDPTKQSEALATMLTAPGKHTVVAARRAVAATTGRKAASALAPLSTRHTKTVLEAVAAQPHPNASEKTLAWWQGVEDALKLVLGSADADERLRKLVERMSTKK